jgi:hypothetical protein
VPPTKTKARVVQPPLRRTLTKKPLEPIRIETKLSGDGGELEKIIRDALRM